MRGPVARPRRGGLVIDELPVLLDSSLLVPVHAALFVKDGAGLLERNRRQGDDGPTLAVLCSPLIALYSKVRV